MTRIKICGLMNEEDVKICVQAGVHTVGFVVEYPENVPWNLTIDEAKELIDKTPPFVCTCVVTGGTPKKILDLANEIWPDIIQLHHNETLEEIKEIVDHLKLKGIKTVKALRINKKGDCNFEINDPVKAVHELAKTGVSAIIVDSYTESMPGGTGVKVDLSIFKKMQKESPLPLILAGGLNPSNISEAVSEVHPYGVDVLTGVELSPGRKDREKIRKFVKGVQSVDY